MRCCSDMRSGQSAFRNFKLRRKENFLFWGALFLRHTNLRSPRGHRFYLKLIDLLGQTASAPAVFVNRPLRALNTDQIS